MVLALFNAAEISRYTRSSMLENLSQDYVRTARAKGMTERVVVLKHVLRNSMIPVVTVIALGIPGIFGGAIITEQVFKVNGIGAALIGAIPVSYTHRDVYKRQVENHSVPDRKARRTVAGDRRSAADHDG